MTDPASQGPFGQYQLIEKIAQGGMAEIFRGRALDAYGIEKPVVIKRILPHIAASAEFVSMLIDEAKIAVLLSHGNIAQIYDLGKVADDYFIVMEYVEGRTISQIMKRLRTQGRTMPISHAAAICAEVAKGLDYMHRKTDDAGNPLHIVHRDISPQNIIVSPAGTVKIIDFGIAKAKTKISTTDSGVVKGKFAYMSPEHAEGERLDHRNDIFSLGIILWELLTGHRLFKGKNNAETLKRVKKARVPPPSSLRADGPTELDEIVIRALEKKRDKRTDSAHAFEQALTRFLIRYDPDFTPGNLADFLKDLFPELIPQGAEAPALEIPTMKSEAGGAREDTVAADSVVMREKLAALAAYDVPPRVEEPSLEPVLSLPSEEGTDRLRRAVTGRRLKTGLMAVGIAIAALVVWRALPDRPPTGHEAMAPGPVSAPASSPETPPVSAVSAAAPAAVGTLVIDSDPKGAKVFLNDRDTGKVTPALVEGLESGRDYRVGLHLDNHQFWEGRFSLEPGQRQSIQAILQQNLGDLEIQSLPAGADIYLDGKLIGKTPYLMTDIRPDTLFAVRIYKEGYADWKREVKIFGGRKEVVSAALEKIRLGGN